MTTAALQLGRLAVDLVRVQLPDVSLVIAFLAAFDAVMFVAVVI